MDWPEQPLETLPHDQFLPEHCPWQECSSNRGDTAFRFHRHGVFVRQNDRRPVPRFLCLACRRTFSLQTFTTIYYLKRPELLVPVAAGLNAGSAHRQLARSLRCNPTTVTRLSARLGRHALLLSAYALEFIEHISEPVVFDHFETFAFAQDYPLGIGTSVGQDSWYVYGIDAASRRRGGRLTPAQKQRRKALKTGRYAVPGAYGRSFREAVDRLLDRVRKADRLELVSDGHPSYAREIKHHAERDRIAHGVYPNPPRGPKGSPRSPEAIERDRQMFAVDLLHGLIRHSVAHHRRETIAFGRRHNAIMERAFLLVVWRNLVKRTSERKSASATPAMRLALTREPWSWRRVFARRLFFWQATVPDSWMRVYRRLWITPALGRNCLHTLRHAA